MLRFFFVVLLVAAAAMALAAYQFLHTERADPYSVALRDTAVPRFTTEILDFPHRFAFSGGMPFMAGAVLDVDGDGSEEVFLGGGERQADALFVFNDGAFINVAEQAGFVKLGDGPTLAAAVLDVDDNGFQDLVVSREKGVWLYRNRGGFFSLEELVADIPQGYVPLKAALGDLNHDGFFDVFLPLVRKTTWLQWLGAPPARSALQPRLYMNNGDGSFYDFTEAAGLGGMDEALQAGFIDLDDDHLEDLAVLHTDGRFTLWKNLGDLLFESKGHAQVGSGKFGAFAPGDYDNDGGIDFLLTGRGAGLPAWLTELLGWNLAVEENRWVLLNSSGPFSFRDLADKARLAEYEPGRGARFIDLNSDGLSDLVVSQNHPYWPLHRIRQLRHSARMLLQNSEGRFVSAGPEAGIINTGYGVTPLVADFNGDGRPDIAHLNLGGESMIFLSTAGGGNYLNVRLADTLKSRAAQVTVHTLAGAKLKQYIAADGLCGESSHMLFFGLGSDRATDVVVEYRTGENTVKSGDFHNTTLTIE